MAACLTGLEEVEREKVGEREHGTGATHDKERKRKRDEDEDQTSQKPEVSIIMSATSLSNSY